MLLRSTTFSLSYVRNSRLVQIVQMKAETACRFCANKYFYISYSMLEMGMEITSCKSLISLAPGEQIIKTVSSSSTQTADIALLIIFLTSSSVNGFSVDRYLVLNMYVNVYVISPGK